MDSADSKVLWDDAPNYQKGENVNRSIIIQAIITILVITPLFFMFFSCFHINWVFAMLFAFIFGNSLVLWPVFILYQRSK